MENDCIKDITKISEEIIWGSHPFSLYSTAVRALHYKSGTEANALLCSLLSQDFLLLPFQETVQS